MREIHLYADVTGIDAMFTNWSEAALPVATRTPRYKEGEEKSQNPMDWRLDTPSNFLRRKSGLLYPYRELTELLANLPAENAGYARTYQTCEQVEAMCVADLWTALRPDVSIRIPDLWRLIMFQSEGEEGRLSLTHANLFPWFRKPGELITLAVKYCHVGKEWNIMPMKRDCPEVWPAGSKDFLPE
jgi:hypothetical protein